MKSRFQFKSSILAFVAGGTIVAGSADAATSIAGNNLQFTASNAEQTLSVRPDSYYNLTMGYKGWTHHSEWLWMKLKKGQLYTVTATAGASSDGLHPGVSCWYRPQGAGLVSVDYAYDHFYNQFTSIIAKNQVDEATQKKLGTMKMYFEINGYDRDGMAPVLTEEYQQGNVIPVLDGEIGKLQLSFVAKNSGVYQCVVGGINPGPEMDLTQKYDVTVSVGGL